MTESTACHHILSRVGAEEIYPFQLIAFALPLLLCLAYSPSSTLIQRSEESETCMTLHYPRDYLQSWATYICIYCFPKNVLQVQNIFINMQQTVTPINIPSQVSHPCLDHTSTFILLELILSSLSLMPILSHPVPFWRLALLQGAHFWRVQREPAAFDNVVGTMPLTRYVQPHQ